MVNTSSLRLTSPLGTRHIGQGIAWDQRGQETCSLDGPGGVREVERNYRDWNWAIITSNERALRLLIQGGTTTQSSKMRGSTEY